MKAVENIDQNCMNFTSAQLAKVHRKHWQDIKCRLQNIRDALEDTTFNLMNFGDIHFTFELTLNHTRA